MVESPCVRNCCLGEDDVCLGCGRSITEITGWHQADDGRKRQICQDAAVRLAKKQSQSSLVGVTGKTGLDNTN